jgi:hypothetical protein
MTSNIDQFKALCSNVSEYPNGEIWGYFGEFVVFTISAYSDILTIFYPFKEGWTHFTYLPYEYEKAYNKLNEVILILKQERYNEKLERIKNDFV